MKKHLTTLLGAFLLAHSAQSICAQSVDIPTMDILYRFSGGTAPRNPGNGVVQGPDGSLYGMVTEGETNSPTTSQGFGGLYRLTPSGQLTWMHTFRYPVTGSNAELLLDAEKLIAIALPYHSAPVGTSPGWVIHWPIDGSVEDRTSHAFVAPHYAMNHGLTKGDDGRYYGVSAFYGNDGPRGTVFAVTTNGVFTILHTFRDPDLNKQNPIGRLAKGDNGELFGVTYGSGLPSQPDGRGSIFKISASGRLTSLVVFNGENGASPRAGLIRGSDGNFYGTTQSGGVGNAGTIFKVTPQGELTTLHSFESGSTGPETELVERDGIFYGSTHGIPSIFSISAQGAFAWVEFASGRFLGAPISTMILGSDGSIYGTTDYGAPFDGVPFGSGNGVVFRVRLPDLAPVINTHPLARTVNAGANVSFTASAGGEPPLRYQWKLNGADIALATNATYTISSAAAVHVGDYTVTVSNSYGSKTSNPATLVVNVPPAITQQPLSQTIAAGRLVTFTVQATGAAPLAYQWRKGQTPIANATSATYAIAAVSATDAGDYSVVITGPSGSVTSAPATLTVQLPPSITAQPISQTALKGSSATFTVAASGTAPFTYQWHRDGVALAGQTQATLTLNAVEAAHAGSYTVTIQNGAGAATSFAANLSLIDIQLYPGLTIFGPVGARYKIEHAAEANASTWTTLREITLPESPHTFSDYTAPLGSRKFYRATLVE